MFHLWGTGGGGDRESDGRERDRKKRGQGRVLPQEVVWGWRCYGIFAHSANTGLAKLQYTTFVNSYYSDVSGGAEASSAPLQCLENVFIPSTFFLFCGITTCNLNYFYLDFM